MPAGHHHESGRWTHLGGADSASDITLISDQKKEKDGIEVPASERRALGVPQTKEEIEEEGISLPTPLATSSKSLARALEAARQSRPEGAAAHHIVARQALDADAARQVLNKYGIGIDDADNGVFLPMEQHMRPHTSDYYRAVNRALASAQSRDDIISLLRSIGKSLKAKRFP